MDRKVPASYQGTYCQYCNWLSPRNILTSSYSVEFLFALILIVVGQRVNLILDSSENVIFYLYVYLLQDNKIQVDSPVQHMRVTIVNTNVAFAVITPFLPAILQSNLYPEAIHNLPSTFIPNPLLFISIKVFKKLLKTAMVWMALGRVIIIQLKKRGVKPMISALLEGGLWRKIGRNICFHYYNFMDNIFLPTIKW